MVKAEGIIKRYINELKISASSEDGEIKTSINEKTIKTAISVSHKRLKDLDEMIDDPKAFEQLVSKKEWEILGADELDDKKLQQMKYEKWLTS